MDKSSGWECFIRQFVPPPADPSWDVGGGGSVLFLSSFPHRLTPRETERGECFIPEFVPPLADPSWDVGGGVVYS